MCKFQYKCTLILRHANTWHSTIGWKFYLVLIIPGSIGGIVMFFVFPDTNGLPLEEVALIFGDADEVAIYQRDIEIDHTTHTIIDHRQVQGSEKTSTEIAETQDIAVDGTRNV